MAQITYENKVKINDSSLPAVNKVRDIDMNEIKTVVNENYQELTNLISNGTGYVKYNDGTLICFGKTTTPTDIPYGSELSEIITLPQNYINNNFIVVASITSGGSSWANVICRGGATSENTIRLIAGNYIVSGSTAKDIILSYITIGKWK
jgi:hypothetical protein